MAANAIVRVCDGQLFKRMSEAGLVWLDQNQEKVNQLNVFPVPDGDTGTNMFLTMQSACAALTSADDKHIGNVTRALSQGALLGARGNSGVILSQWLRGFAETLKDKPYFDAALFAAACKSAVDRAYRGVIEPVEGTILTVMRQSMEAVAERAQTEIDLQKLFKVKAEAANVSLAHTPELLAKLKEAGVVDSGGQGFTFIIEGMLRLLRGEEITPVTTQPIPSANASWQAALVPEDEQGYGYDVQFLMRGQNMDVDSVREAISAIGWSTLVVGDEQIIKVHVHVHDPGVPISYAIKQGASLDDIVVENMQEQYRKYVAQRTAHETIQQAVSGVAVIAAASGEGFQKLFQELGTSAVIFGGQTMNPSTADFLKVVQSLPNQDVILLPNNSNIDMAARQAASLVDGKSVRVVSTRSIPQGIAAMLEYGNERDNLELDELAAAMDDARKNIVSIEVTTAIRDSVSGEVTVRGGQLMGLIDDQIAAAGDAPYPLMKTLLQKAGADKRELITVYYGENLDEGLAHELLEDLQADFPEQEFQLVNGGQPLYPYIVSVE
jgi:DAK2 domain fusion protein YloV